MNLEDRWHDFAPTWDLVASKVVKKAKVMRRLDPPALDRRSLNPLRIAIAWRMEKGFAKAKKKFIADLRKVEKADKKRTAADQAVDDVTNADDIDSIREQLIDVAADGGKVAVVQLGLDDDQLFGQINDRAVKWAAKRSSTLVTDIDRSTRDSLRSLISAGLDDGLTLDEIADDIASGDIGVFSEERAMLIASTEVANANSEGALMGYKEASNNGVNVKKVWLLGDDACDDCQENADEGPIDLDEEFPSGDDAPTAHPNCHCALAAEVEEDSSEDNTDE